MRSEKKQTSGFPVKILVRDEMRVLCEVSETHPLAERGGGKSIASMSAMEFARWLDTASPQELRTLAGTGLRKKANERRRSAPSPSKRQQPFQVQQSFEVRPQPFQVNPDSPGSTGWGMPMHYSLLALHAFFKASSYPTVQKIIVWSRPIGPAGRMMMAVGAPVSVVMILKLIYSLSFWLALCLHEYHGLFRSPF